GLGRVVPTQGSGRNGCYSAAASASVSEPGRASARGLVFPGSPNDGRSQNHRREIEAGVHRSCGGSCDEERSWPGAKPDPFSLSPFRFVDSQGQDSWQLPSLGSKHPRSTPSRSNPRASAMSRRANGSRERKSSNKRSSSSTSAGDSRVSWHLSSIARPVTTFGTGTREQAGQALAPGFKGYAPRCNIANPGPGAYRNVPGSLGNQVDSTLCNSVSSSFGQSTRSRSARDPGVPGPGSYRAVSSLG
ncbi:unnamed protein product, partial [Ectocarpus fasciculatus]